jgi:hypothetical protein
VGKQIVPALLLAPLCASRLGLDPSSSTRQASMCGASCRDTFVGMLSVPRDGVFLSAATVSPTAAPIAEQGLFDEDGTTLLAETRGAADRQAPTLASIRRRLRVYDEAAYAPSGVS